MEQLRVNTKDLTRTETSSYCPYFPAGAATAAIIDRYEVLICWRPEGGGPVEAHKIPQGEERRVLEARARELRSSLRPLSMAVAERDKAVGLIARMFAGYPSQKNSDARATVATYVLELGSAPLWALEAVCEKIRKGQIADLNPDFPPSTVRLNQLIALETGYVMAEEAKINTLLQAKLAVQRRSEQESKRAFDAATAWLERTDPRAQKLTENLEAKSAARALENRDNTMEANRRLFARECLAAGISPNSAVSPSLMRILKDKESEGGNELG